MKEPIDGWSDEERAILQAFEGELGTLHDRYAHHPPLAVLRAARAGVLPDELQAIADRYVEANPWVRALVGDPELTGPSIEGDKKELPPHAAVVAPFTIDAERDLTSHRRLNPVLRFFDVSWSWRLATVGAMAAIVVAALVWRGTSVRDASPVGREANKDVAPSSAAPPSPAIVDRIEDGSRVITVTPDGSVGGVDDVPPAFRDALVRSIVTARLETDPTVDEVIPKSGTLLGSSAPSSKLALIAPVGIAVESQRPTFRWIAVVGAEYQVSVFDQAYNPVMASGWLPAAEWVPPMAFDRGKRFSWQVRVRTGGRETIVPSPPAPEARFLVIGDEAAHSLNQLRERPTQSHLVLGIVYTHLGLFDAAERELAAAVQQNPSSIRAQQLATDLDRLRSQ